MEGGNFCFVRFWKKTTSFSFLFSPSGSEQQTITFAPVQVPLCGSEPKCFFISPFFWGRRIYFYEAISKLKRSYKSQKRRRRNGEEEGRSVMMREGGGGALLHQWFTTLEKWHACEHLDGEKGYDPSGTCQQHSTQKENQIKRQSHQNRRPHPSKEI